MDISTHRSFNESSVNWSPQPEYNELFLRGMRQYSYERLRIKGHLFLNEVYDMLGMDRSSYGAIAGWHVKSGEIPSMEIFHWAREAGTGTPGYLLIQFENHEVIFHRLDGLSERTDQS